MTTDRHVAEISLEVNGTTHTFQVEHRKLLSDALREELQQSGINVGCEQGVCGSCTVLLDGLPARSCLTLAVQAAGHKVETVERLNPADGSLNPVQASFKERHGLQCGFCTTGILMSLEYARRRRYRQPEYLEEVLQGHLCRCTGYKGIVEAATASLAQDVSPDDGGADHGD